MIDFQNISYGTSELIDIAMKSNGIYVYQYKRIGIEKLANSCSYERFEEYIRGRETTTIYFEHFFYQTDIDYDKLIELDKRGFDLIVRGDPFRNAFITNRVPEIFYQYCSDNYPEYYI